MALCVPVFQAQARMEGDGVVKQPAGVDARLRHAQTQHGHYSTVDEENIVVLQRCFTPPPLEEEAAKEVVWFEEVMISEVSGATFQFTFCGNIRFSLFGYTNQS